MSVVVAAKTACVTMSMTEMKVNNIIKMYILSCNLRYDYVSPIAGGSKVTGVLDLGDASHTGARDRRLDHERMGADLSWQDIRGKGVITCVE